VSELLGERGASCAVCGRRAAVRVRYARLSLCPEHFAQFLEGRLAKFAEERAMFSEGDRVVVAVSGGKDSLSLALMLHRLKDRLRLGAVTCLHIDLGIPGYSEESRSAVERLAADAGMSCLVIRVDELLGATLPELVARSRRPPCSACGLVKRHLINAAALEMGADAVAVGHHLDDVLTLALKGYLLQGKVDHLKMSPVLPAQEGLLVRKVRPLHEIYEDDLRAYAALSGLRPVSTPCPFKHEDRAAAAVRQMLDRLEALSPGFKLSLVRRLERQMERAELGGGGARACPLCGLPTSGEGPCGLCRLTAAALGEPAGARAREGLRRLLSRA